MSLSSESHRSKLSAMNRSPRNSQFVAESDRSGGNLGTRHLQLASEVGAVLWDKAHSLWGLCWSWRLVSGLNYKPSRGCPQKERCSVWKTHTFGVKSVVMEKQFSFIDKISRREKKANFGESPSGDRKPAFRRRRNSDSGPARDFCRCSESHNSESLWGQSKKRTSHS